jgi:hypothetical protein
MQQVKNLPDFSESRRFINVSISAHHWTLSRDWCIKTNHMTDRQPQFDSGYVAAIHCGLFKPEDEGAIIIRNVGIYLSIDTT